MEDEQEKLSKLRTRRQKKVSALNLSSCFHGSSPSASASAPLPPPPSPPHFLSPSWFRSKKASAPSSPSRKISSSFRRRRHHSADFGYDALSYSLNFDDGSGGGDDFNPPSSSARLPRHRVLDDLNGPPARTASALSVLSREGEIDTSAGRVPDRGETSSHVGQDLYQGKRVT